MAEGCLLRRCSPTSIRRPGVRDHLVREDAEPYVSTRSKRRKVEEVPRGEWVAIPVSLEGSGLERAKVEAARASVADNRASAQWGTATAGSSAGASCDAARAAAP